jgi:murein tripeptide amidase MpaA
VAVVCSILAQTNGGRSSHPAVTALRSSAGTQLLDKKQNKRTGLMQLIDFFKTSKCILAHNRVYRYLSITSDYNNDFSIDYGKLLDELYYDLMHFHYHHVEHNLQQLVDMEQKYEDAVRDHEKAVFETLLITTS